VFQACSCPLEVPYDRAIAASESPRCTVYVVPVAGAAVGEIAGDAGAVGVALGSEDGEADGEADGAKVPPGIVDGEAAGVAHAASMSSSTKPTDARLA
jgi:hypothetical protein